MRHTGLHVILYTHTLRCHPNSCQQALLIVLRPKTIEQRSKDKRNDRKHGSQDSQSSPRPISLPILCISPSQPCLDHILSQTHHSRLRGVLPNLCPQCRVCQSFARSIQRISSAARVPLHRRVDVTAEQVVAFALLGYARALQKVLLQRLDSTA